MITILEMLLQKRSSIFGITKPSQLANHIMHYMPTGMMINRTTYGFVNSWNTVFHGINCKYLTVHMNELSSFVVLTHIKSFTDTKPFPSFLTQIGHNLSFGHSNQNGTNKDQTCTMGYSYSIDDGPFMCFNGAKSLQAAGMPIRQELSKLAIALRRLCMALLTTPIQPRRSCLSS